MTWSAGDGGERDAAADDDSRAGEGARVMSLVFICDQKGLDWICCLPSIACLWCIEMASSVPYVIRAAKSRAVSLHSLSIRSCNKNIYACASVAHTIKGAS